MDGISYVRATPDDIDRLIEARDEVIRAVWGLSEDDDITGVLDETRDYFERAIPSGKHVAFVAYDGPAFLGCSGISYYRVMPTPDNPTGRKGYVMNMYVRGEYRRRGVASRMLELLLADAAERGVDFVALEASEDGRPFYETFGFRPMPDEMLRHES